MVVSREKRLGGGGGGGRVGSEGVQNLLSGAFRIHELAHRNR